MRSPSAMSPTWPICTISLESPSHPSGIMHSMATSVNTLLVGPVHSSVSSHQRPHASSVVATRMTPLCSERENWSCTVPSTLPEAT